VALEQYHIYNVAVSTTNGWTARMNGVLVFSTNFSANCFESWSSAPRLGASSAGYFDGSIGEILVYNKTLDPSERNGVNSYLQNKYAIHCASPSVPTISAQTVSKSQISIVWSGTVKYGDMTFMLERCKDGMAFEPIACLTNTFSYFDAGLDVNTSYFYRVKAVSYMGQSAYSALANAITFADGPEIPANDALVWLKGDAGHKSGGVARWIDQTTNGNDAIQPLCARRPLDVDDAINGRPVMRFTANSKQYFTLPMNLLSGSNAAEAFVVLRVATNRLSWMGLDV
jgi:hypothetical protein